MKIKTVKMNKVILILTLSVISLKAFGQTKEETIIWLKEKMTNNLKGEYHGKGVLYYSKQVQSITIDECVMLVKIKEETSFSGGQTNFYDLIVPIQNLQVGEDGALYNFGIKLIETRSTDPSATNIGVPSLRKTTDGFVKIDFRLEENLRERIQKAIDHLATFCPPKEKETF